MQVIGVCPRVSTPYQMDLFVDEPARSALGRRGAGGGAGGSSDIGQYWPAFCVSIGTHTISDTSLHFQNIFVYRDIDQFQHTLLAFSPKPSIQKK